MIVIRNETDKKMYCCKCREVFKILYARNHLDYGNNKCKNCILKEMKILISFLNKEVDLLENFEEEEEDIKKEKNIYKKS